MGLLCVISTPDLYEWGQLFDVYGNGVYQTLCRIHNTFRCKFCLLDFLEELSGKIRCGHAKVFGGRPSVSGTKGKGKMPFIQEIDSPFLPEQGIRIFIFPNSLYSVYSF